jgi:uncharacterized protein YbaA (DUF1428 family)
VGDVRVAQFVYRVPKKNHDTMMQLNKQFVDTMRKYGAAHLIFQLTNTEAPMEGITSIAKTVSANLDEEVWLELIFYRDRKHRDEVDAKMRNDESMAPLFQVCGSIDLRNQFHNGRIQPSQDIDKFWVIKMLGDKDTAANIAVKNLEIANKFY